MSTNSESDVRQETSATNGEEQTSGKEQSAMNNFMLQMQQQMHELTKTVKNLTGKQNGDSPKSEADANKKDGASQGGSKRKRDDADDEGPGHSRVKDSNSTEGDAFMDLIEENERGNESDEDDCMETDAILQELAECFEADDKCGEPIFEKLAKVANDGMRTKLNSDKIKETSDKYLRPKNVQNLVTPKINGEIWPHLNRKVKNQDLRLMKTQSLVCKAIMPQLMQLDKLLKANSTGGQVPMKEITKLAMDGLKLMTFVYCDLSYRRRELIIQPEKNEEFKALCSTDQPVTDNLFGDDLGKVVEDIVKGNKVGSKISGNNGKEQRFKKHHSGFKSSHYRGNTRGHPFLGQRNQPPFRRKWQGQQGKRK